MVPGSGLLAACVPGPFETWMMLLRDHGTLTLRDVLEPAIFYASQGQPLVERASATIATVEPLFRDHWKTSAAVYLPGGKVPAPGTLLKNPALAATYERILKEAESAGGDRVKQIERARQMWSRGFVAEAIDKFCRTTEAMDSSGTPHRGLLTADDMASWAPTVEAPATFDYGRFTVCKAGFWSQGPVLLQQLALLKGFDLDGLDPAGPDFIHILVECSKLAFADREKFYGDPNFGKVPSKELLSEAYNAERRKLVTDKASLDLRPGSISGFGGEVHIGKAPERDGERVSRRWAGLELASQRSGRLGAARGDTVHFDIIDKHGNMVSSTPSGGWLQSSPVIPELGFPLGTRAQMFWLDESHPAALAPGKRPRSTLSPTMALRDGEPHLCWGSPGGDQQDQWSCQFLMRYIHAGHNLQQAIDAPAWHSEHFPISFWPRTARPGVLAVESRVRRGHDRGAAAPRTYRRGRTASGRRDASPRRRVTACGGGPPPTRAACRATPRGGERSVGGTRGTTPRGRRAGSRPAKAEGRPGPR